ncbi:MAG TPA: chemotaxis-specific protein-glutamate methyltransferase CheB [Burkholderiaceae bacterium]
MSRLRVLVVEDSLTVRRRLCEVLEAEPDLEVVGEAEDGQRAIELCLALKPDVITLDMMLPVMSGLAATEYLMAYCPTPILVVSSSVNRGELFKTYEALAAGAVEVMEKPRPNEPEGEWERQFVSMVKIVARVKVVTHLRGRRAPHPAQVGNGHALAAQEAAAKPHDLRGPCRLIAIGTSTGGPGALVEVLRALPPNFRIPILFVIHISEPFGSTFADWLDSQTEHRVHIAYDGEDVPRNGVVMAPPNRHLIVRDRKLLLSDGPERHSCRPSVDVLFDSVAREYGATAAAAILTGMGQDGARGLLAVREAGGLTVAQDEASSVVYGMPREAAQIGAAQKVLPLSEIGAALASLG